MRTPDLTKKGQSDRFIETARALGCDEDEETFKAKLGQIARRRPKDETAPTKVGKKQE